MSTQDDMAKLAQAMQRFAKSYGDAIAAAFKPFSEAVEHMREQKRPPLP